MHTFVSLTSECQRIKELLSFQILDTPNEKEFDNLVKIVARLFDTPAAAITFVDEKRQWIKASVGLNVCETDRKHAVCNYTIRQYAVTEIPDMSKDTRFTGFPFVAGEPFFRFYAGIPLKTEGGYHIGALCLLDTRARSFSEEEKGLLGAFARSAMAQVEISAKHRALMKINEVSDRISCIMSRNMNDQETSKTMLDLQEDCAASLLRADDLKELNNLLKKEADNISSILNGMKQRRRHELQSAVNGIKDASLKQLVSNLIREIESETL
jgi:hypothetical protein